MTEDFASCRSRWWGPLGNRKHAIALEDKGRSETGSIPAGVPGRRRDGEEPRALKHAQQVNPSRDVDKQRIRKLGGEGSEKEREQETDRHHRNVTTIMKEDKTS